MKASVSPSGLAIVTTLRECDHTLDTWVNYHLTIFDRVFIFLDNQLEHWDCDDSRVTVRTGAQQRNFTAISSIMERQDSNVALALKDCLHEGIEWLLHIDGDELFCPQDDDWHKANAGMISFANHEVIPVWECENPFKELHYFGVNGKRPFRAYGNGKCAVRVTKEVHPRGPHWFCGFSGICETSEAILHYTDATYRMWLRKYENLGDFDNYWYGDLDQPITLKFYLESRDALRWSKDIDDFSTAQAFFWQQIPFEEQLARELKSGTIRKFVPIH